jgi:hypothetical protein
VGSGKGQLNRVLTQILAAGSFDKKNSKNKMPPAPPFPWVDTTLRLPTAYLPPCLSEASPQRLSMEACSPMSMCLSVPTSKEEITRKIRPRNIFSNLEEGKNIFGFFKTP